MLIVPLPAKPDWRNPPWATLLIIATCCVIYFGFQVPDNTREQAAIDFYYHEGLASLELPRYVKALDEQGQESKASHLRKLLSEPVQKGRWISVLLSMQEDQIFIQRLHDGKIVRSDEVIYSHWKDARRSFETKWSKLFTLRYALHPAAPQLVQVFMQMFMHGSVDHLLGNMAMLFMVAYTVEGLIGSGRFLIFYLIAGLGATLPDLIWPGEGGAISLGASGAIAGVMAMFVVLYGLRKVRFFFWVIVYFSTMNAPALLVLPYWLGNEVWQHFTTPGSHVNYWAHFSGLLSGTILIGVYRLRRAGHTAESIEKADAANSLARQRASADAFMERLDFPRAARAFSVLTVTYPENADLALSGFRAASMQPDNALLQSAINQLFKLGIKQPRIFAADTAKAWRLIQQRQLKLPSMAATDWLQVLGQWSDAGQFDVAEQLLVRLLARDPSQGGLPAIIYRLGLARRRQGDEAACQATWRILLTRFPHAPEVGLVMGS